MKYDKDKYNYKISDLVADATSDIKEMFKEHNLCKICFTFHPNVDAPHCIFEREINGKSEYKRLPIYEISLNGNDLVIIAEDTRFSGYLDGFYGDYFDVGQRIGQIYESVVEVIEENKFASIELN